MIELDYVQAEGKPPVLVLSKAQIEAYTAIPEDDPNFDLARAALDLDTMKRGQGEVKTAKWEIPEATWDAKSKVGVLVRRAQKADAFWREAAADELWPLQVLCSYEALPPRLVEGYEGEPTGEMKEILAAECAYRIFIEPQLSEARADFLTGNAPS